MTPEFIYFDLGNVLLFFDHAIACRNAAQLADITPQRVHEIIFESDLEFRYERGDLNSREFYEIFCEQSGSNPGMAELRLACSQIFKLNNSIVPIVCQLKAAGYRLGILSNTCEAHWSHVFDGRYRLLRDFFDVYVLSYEANSMKPEARIYEIATATAAVPAEQIFFVDDRADNIAGACAFGLDAVQFLSHKKLADDLRQRGVTFNY